MCMTVVMVIISRVELILCSWWKWMFHQRQLGLHCTLGFAFLGDLAMDMEMAIDNQPPVNVFKAPFCIK